MWQNPVKEIGWFPVRIISRSGPLADLPEDLMVFHWHGDTFEIPPGAVWLAQSQACRNQAFNCKVSFVVIPLDMDEYAG